MSEAKKYKVKIGEQYYSILSDESQELVLNTASVIDSLISEIVQKGFDVQSATVLVALRFGFKANSLDLALSNLQVKHNNLLNLIDQNI